MTAKKHFLLFLTATLWLNAAAPVANPLETETEYQRMLDYCRAAACAQLPALLNNFGGFYFSQARYAEAEPLLKEAASLKGNDQLAVTWANLAALYRITGRYAEAVTLFDRSLQLLEQVNPNAPELPKVLTGAALLALEPRADKSEATVGEARCKHALSLVIEDSAEAATAHNILGSILEVQARFKEAQQELEKALTLRERLLSPDDSLIAETLDKLGLVYRQLGRLDEAEALYRRAIVILRAHPALVELGTALNNLGNTLAAHGRLREAEPALREALAVWEKVLGPEHPNVAAALSNLSTLARSRHQYDEAERLLGRAIAIDRKLMPEGNVRIGFDLNNTGTLLASRKRYPKAEVALRESLSILEKQLPENHPEIGRVAVNLAEVLRLEGKIEEAGERYQQGLEILTRAWGPEDARLLAWLGDYAKVLRTREDFAEAAKVDMQAMKIQVGQTIGFRRLPM